MTLRPLVLGARAAGARLERMQASERFREGRFWNIAPGVMEKAPGVAVLGEYFFGGNERVPRKPLPVVDDTLARLARPADDGLRLTWLGHSTVLVELDGVRLLTDPVFGSHASPSTMFGPKRFHPPPVALDALPPLDAVVISHDHYDHLCMPSIRALAAGASGFTGPFIMPLGVGAHLEAWGVPPERIVEREWGEHVDVAGAPGSAAGGGRAEARLVATPAQHFSGRGPRDRFSTLWCGWAMLGRRHRVFFSGDTGLCDDFAAVGRAYGPFDVAMFEIGAWHPAWGDIHLGPDNAAVAFGMLGAKALLPVHWGTFNLALHDWNEPIETLSARAEADGLLVLAPRLGQPAEPSVEEHYAPWWRL